MHYSTWLKSLKSHLVGDQLVRWLSHESIEIKDIHEAFDYGESPKGMAEIIKRQLGE